MRHNITFLSQQLRCSAWLYVPDDLPAGQAPAIVMAHGFSCVKEQRLESFALHFATAGMTTSEQSQEIKAFAKHIYLV